MNNLEPQTLRCRGGEPLAYFRSGSGPAVVLINAYGVSLAFWDHVIDVLLPQYSIFTWECRGCNSNGAGRPYTIDEHAEDLHEILQHEGIPTVHLLGWCTGPKVALEFQHRHPESVASLTFITGSFSPLPEGEAILTRYDRILGKMATLVRERPEMAAVFLKTLSGMLSGQSPSPAGPGQNLADLVGMISPRFHSMVIDPFLSEGAIVNYARMICEYQEHGIGHLLDSVQSPTLVIGAENDQIAHPDGSRIVARAIPHARLRVLPGAGHWCLLENGDEVSQEISTFLEKVPVRRTAAAGLTQHRGSGAHH